MRTDRAFSQINERLRTVEEVIDIGEGRMFTTKAPDGKYFQVFHLHTETIEAQKQMNML